MQESVTPAVGGQGLTESDTLEIAGRKEQDWPIEASTGDRDTLEKTWTNDRIRMVSMLYYGWRNIRNAVRVEGERIGEKRDKEERSEED
jgi:hypothetical protein